MNKLDFPLLGIVLVFNFGKKGFIKHLSMSPYAYVNLFSQSKYLKLELLNHSVCTFSVLMDISKFFSKMALRQE